MQPQKLRSAGFRQRTDTSVKWVHPSLMTEQRRSPGIWRAAHHQPACLPVTCFCRWHRINAFGPSGSRDMMDFPNWEVTQLVEMLWLLSACGNWLCFSIQVRKSRKRPACIPVVMINMKRGFNVSYEQTKGATVLCRTEELVLSHHHGNTECLTYDCFFSFSV